MNSVSARHQQRNCASTCTRQTTALPASTSSPNEEMPVPDPASVEVDAGDLVRMVESALMGVTLFLERNDADTCPPALAGVATAARILQPMLKNAVRMLQTATVGIEPSEHDADKPLLAYDADLPQLSVEHRAYEVMVRTRFNRDVLALIQAIQVLRPLANTITERTTDDLVEEFRQSGAFSEEQLDEAVEPHLETAEYLLRDVRGLDWALEMFVGVAAPYSGARG